MLLIRLELSAFNGSARGFAFFRAARMALDFSFAVAFDTADAVSVRLPISVAALFTSFAVL